VMVKIRPARPELVSEDWVTDQHADQNTHHVKDLDTFNVWIKLYFIFHTTSQTA
jgi:hypothetical protein